MHNVYLVGFMGTGKSEAGKLLAERLGFKFLDLDEIIESREGRKITEIFASSGEAYFRGLEKKILGEISQDKRQVVACGGGIILDPENIKLMKDTGSMICLSARPEVILERTERHAHRPLLNVEDKLKKIKEILEFRQPMYERADINIDTSDLNLKQVVEKAAGFLKK